MMKYYSKYNTKVNAIKFNDTTESIVAIYDIAGCDLRIKYQNDTVVMHIETTEGDLIVANGDYVILDEFGKLSTCNPTEFENTYKEIKE